MNCNCNQPEPENQVRSKVREEDEKKALLTRLSRIEGQVRGVKNMVEEGR